MIIDKNIIETINMIEKHKLDIRTVTIGINLMDCIDSDMDKLCTKIYDKITHESEELVSTAEKVSKKYQIPIINKRISITPISIIASAVKETSYLKIGYALDKAAKAVGVNFIGGFSALCDAKMTKSDINLINSIPETLANTDILCGSVNLGSTKHGINMDATKLMGEKIKELAYLTRNNDSIGCAKLVVFCNAVNDNPFMAGAFHGVNRGDSSINVGISGPGVVKSALENKKGEKMEVIAEEIKKTSFKITRMGELVGKEVASRLGKDFGIVDLSLAPTPSVGDSVARILEEIGVETLGGYGTTLALAMLNDAVKKGGLMASSNVGGLSGAFIPLSEDEGMIKSAEKGILNMEKLEAMTAVCSVGLDMIAIPGNTTADVISAIIGDEAAIGMINGKTTAVRVIPVYGKKAGDSAVFGDLLGYAPIIKINETSAKRLIDRGGFVPAPVHSFKN